MNVVGAVVAIAWSLLLMWWDLHARRLPNWLTLPAAFLALPWLTWPALLWPGCYLSMAVILGKSRARNQGITHCRRGSGGIGGGDIKLAISLGIAVAHWGGLWGVIVAMALANLATVAHYILARPRRLSAHGPAMFLGAGLVITAAMWIKGWV